MTIRKLSRSPVGNVIFSIIRGREFNGRFGWGNSNFFVTQQGRTIFVIGILLFVALNE